MPDTPMPARPPYSLRLTAKERKVLAAAADRDEYVSAFIRRTSLEAARQELATA